jgi:hypothetical protein
VADEIKQTIVIEASLTKIQQDLKSLESSFKGTFGNIQQAAGQLSGVLGVGLGIGAVVGFGKSVLNLGDQLSDLSAQTGLTIATLGGIKPVLDSSNSSLETFAKGFGKFQRSLGDFEGEGKQAAEALRAIKLDPAQLANESADKALQQIISGLGGVANANERAAIAGRLFSKSSAELIPTVLQLAENGIPKLDAATAEAYERLGKLADQITFAKAAFANLTVQPLVAVVESLFDVGRTTGDVVAGLSEVIKALSGGKDAFDLVTTAAKGTSYVFELGAFSALALTESLLKILRVAPLVAEALTFNQIDFGSKNFDKAIEGVESKMEKIGDRFLANFDPSKNLVEAVKKRQPPFQGLLPNTSAIKTATEAANAFLESIEKEILKLQEQNIAFFQGADAAKKFAIEQELAAKKQHVIAQLIAGGTSPAGAQKAVAQAFAGIDPAALANKIKAAREEFIALSERASRDPEFLNRVFEIRNLDELPKKLESVIERIRQAQEPAPSGALKILDIQAIEAEFKKAQSDANFFSQVFGDAFDKSGKEVEDLRAKLQKLRSELKLGPQDELVIKTKAELDQAEVDRVLDNLKKSIEDTFQRANILGPLEINVPAEIGDAQRAAIDQLLKLRTGAGRAAAAQLGPQAKLSEADTVLRNLDLGLHQTAVEAELLGSAVDLPAETVGKLTDAIRQLISQGLDPLDPRLQQLKAQLEDAKAAQHFADAFSGVASGFSSFLDDLSGGAKLKDALKNLTSNIRRALNEAFITKPLEDFIKSQANSLFGKIFLTLPGLGKGAAGIAGTAADQASIAAIQTAATAATTEITTVGSTAEAGITTLGATTEASISALQATAIAAIETANASSLGGALPGIAGAAQSSFGGFGLNLAQILTNTYSSGGKVEWRGAPRLETGGKVGSSSSSEIRAKDSPLPHFQSGGLAPGEVPIIAHQGEYVLPKKAVDRIGLADLERIRKAGAIPKEVAAKVLTAHERMLPRFEGGGRVVVSEARSSMVEKTVNSTQITNVANSAGLSRFQAGGLAPGEVPIIAHQGEYVVPKKVVDRIGVSNLDWIRKNGAIPAEVAAKALTRSERAMPRFEGGGKIFFHTRALPSFDFGGQVGSSESSPSVMAAPASLLERRTTSRGADAMTINIINPNFQNRQSMQQISAQLGRQVKAAARNS